MTRKGLQRARHRYYAYISEDGARGEPGPSKFVTGRVLNRDLPTIAMSILRGLHHEIDAHMVEWGPNDCQPEMEQAYLQDSGLTVLVGFSADDVFDEVASVVTNRCLLFGNDAEEG